MKDLTDKQRRFADLVLLGKKHTDAYLAAYAWHGNRNAAAARGREMLNQPKVAAYIAKERAKTAEAIGAVRSEKRRILQIIMNDTRIPARDRIAAIQTDNIMCGDNKPVRFEGEIALHSIFRKLKATVGLPDPNELIELDRTTTVHQLAP